MIRTHASERVLCVMPALPGPRVLASNVCCNLAPGAGSSKASTATTDNRIAATDEAKVTTGGSQLVESGAIGVGSGGKFTEGPSLEGASAGRDIKLGSTDVTGDVTITTADSDILKSALDNITALAAQQSGSLEQFVTQSERGRSQDLNIVLDQLKGSSAGAFPTWAIWLIGGGAVAVLLYAFRKRIFS